MEIKVLVADDELPARGELKYQLASIPHVNVIGECANGKEVISFLETHPQVDLLFLDIEMPIMNGLEAAQKIIGMNHSVKIVFATGYSQFALQAFELEAFDYILKLMMKSVSRKPSSAFSTVLYSGKTVPPPGKS